MRLTAALPQVPFEAKTLKELRTKVDAGEPSSPISSFYSEDLRGLCKLMLTVDVNDRPTISQLLKMPCIASRMKGNNASDSQAPVLDTIKVPANLRQLHGKLPGAITPSTT